MFEIEINTIKSHLSCPYILHLLWQAVDVYELAVVVLDHFSSILPLMVFYLCCFGWQVYVTVNGEFALFSPNRGQDGVRKLKFPDVLV